ncbi:hypothetical protein NLX83_34025 [Allokutzneria sp. A3M-2-11 16]|uniref:hypothetical protein n=1 Tax=Allokutzneria sp. A3M-2-11 16 TaxID=2962043 RepID=UPI0020B694CC|nr:hypothetical protein [Allokutzneria sp. A3M-2-11 16]MCP3804298.1 hypothetical protein [Allokutzneria sp. A3M-2-11 16]
MGRFDALSAQLVEYGPAELRVMEVAVPYRPADSPQGFALHKLKIFRFDDIEQGDLDVCTEAFFHGVCFHPSQKALWDEYLDESI